MSYDASGPLQAALYQHLSADPALSAQIGTALYDQVPAGTLPGTYVTLGPENARIRRDASGQIAVHDITISVYTDAGGFQGAKEVAATISTRLQDGDLALSNGRLLALDFTNARARLLRNGALRRIDLRFRARIDTQTP